jgi:hypothetical protein
MLKKLIGHIDPHIWLAIKHYYDIAKVVICTSDNQMSEAIDSQVGVKQGGPMSPILFSIYVNQMLELVVESGWTCTLNGIRTGIVAYADDTTTSSETAENTQKTLNLITEYCHEHGVAINATKTYWMKVGEKVKRTRDTEPQPLPPKDNERFVIENQPIEKTYKFKFLGVWITSDNDNTEHIKKRKKDSMAAFMGISNLGLNNEELYIAAKSTLYQSYVRPIMIYGLETLTLKKKEVEEIVQFDTKLMKMMLGLTKYSYSNQVNMILKIPKLEDVLQMNKLNLLKQLIENNYTRELVKYTYDMDSSSILAPAFEIAEHRTRLGCQKETHGN